MSLAFATITIGTLGASRNRYLYLGPRRVQPGAQ